MAINKKEIFEPELIELADLAKALSHPARIAILRTLAEKQVCICGEIVEVMPLAQATVSQHLKELKKAGLITGEVEGKKSCYCINWEALNRFANITEALFQSLEAHNQSDCC
mgnify:CR=1 FL=1|jgi:ArsR family transcriptional regulator